MSLKQKIYHFNNALLGKLTGVNLQGLRANLSGQENGIRMLTNDHQLGWLYFNRHERMDPTVPDLFPADRAAFHLQRYEFAATHVADREVADIASGTGYGSEHLATSGGARSITGIDIDHAAVRYATEKHGQPNCTFLHASGDQTGLPPEQFDVVVSFETIEHVPDDAKLLEEFARLLRPGGKLVISTPNEWELTPYHVRTFQRDSFVEALSRQFEVESLFNQNSGSEHGQYTRNQEAGIVPTTDQNHRDAECYIAVCRKK